MAEIIIKKERHECAPAVAAYIKELEKENNHLLEKIQSFYKNEKLDLIDRRRFLRELNDEIDENAKCRMAVTADELLEFIEEFEPVTEGKLVTRLSELEEENARLEELYQKSVGVIAADPIGCNACRCTYKDVLRNCAKCRKAVRKAMFGGADDECKKV